MFGSPYLTQGAAEQVEPNQESGGCHEELDEPAVPAGAEDRTVALQHQIIVSLFRVLPQFTHQAVGVELVVDLRRQNGGARGILSCRVGETIIG